MRILSIHIRNLNSLAGEWKIRLDGPEYEAGGIFAITGPTGAGKSTILDAVCLALYGATPRLDKVTKSSNEIMSRHTSECMAKVRFCTTRGEYECCWSQRRARGSGKLQPPQHHLYDAKEHPLADKTTDVVARVEELTGMDFARFTQSVLLAQGRFATFLLADGDKRAPLLEKITGTGIYSEISRKTQQRSSEEQKKLDDLKNRLDAQQLLPEDEEAALERERETLHATCETLANREQALNDDMARLEQAAALDREEQALNAEGETLQRDEATFAPQREKLERAERASGIVPALEALRSRREEQRSDEKALAALKEEAPRLAEQERQASAALAAAKTALTAEKDAVEKARDLWKRVRAADTEIDARRRDLNNLDLELDARRSALELRRKEQSDAERGKNDAEAALAGVSREKEASAADAGLSEAVGALETRVDRLEEDEKALEAERLALNELSLGLENQETELAGRRRSEEALGKTLSEASDKLTAARSAFAELLRGRDVSAFRAERDALSARLGALDKALDAASTRAEHLSRAERLALAAQALTLTVQQESSELALLRERVNALREAQALRAKIRSYEEERRALREGSPCPLCGSTHHPFAESAPALPDEDAERLAALERDRDRVSASLAGHQRDAVHAAEGRAEASAAAEDATRKLRLALSALSPTLAAALTQKDDAASPEPTGPNAPSAPADESTHSHAAPAPTSAPAEAWENDILAALALSERAPALPALLETLRAKTADALAHAEEALRDLDARQQAGRRLAEDVERLRLMHDNALADVQSAEKEALRLGTEVSARRKELDSKAGKADAERLALQHDIAAFRRADEAPATLREAVNLLAERRRRYADLLAREVEARNALAEQTRLIDVRAQALNSAIAEHDSAQENRNRLASALASLESARRALFGLRSVDNEEQAARNRLQELEKQEEALRGSLDDASRALARSRSDAAALAERLTQRASALRDMEAALEKHLAAERFADEQACRAALLSKEAMDELASERDHLAKRAAALDARQKDLARKRAEQRLPLPPRDATEQALAETRAERENALRTLGSLQERLSANAERKSQAAELTGQLKKQADTCRRWNALNALIGSADGKKFRNYAQELTFRRLIIMANRQLAFMTDRYLLVHSKTEALTLNVIDRYQADAVRSSRNLSGGESFIVSLALALGLAQMASRNVRVDSVFLDEGFGTLDEEALGTALDMLASLRQKGKMIGIISHVQAVRDRVSLQIQVSPLGNGKSALSGPGVSRV